MIYNERILEKQATSFKKGLLAVESTTGIVINGSESINMKKVELEEKILDYINKHKEVHLSDILKEFDVEFSLLLEIINELKKKKLITRID